MGSTSVARALWPGLARSSLNFAGAMAYQRRASSDSFGWLGTNSSGPVLLMTIREGPGSYYLLRLGPELVVRQRSLGADEFSSSE